MFQARLSALAVTRAKTPGYLCDGAGLYLLVGRAGSKSWVFRFKKDGKAREMGLGSASVVSLAEAREKAAIAKKRVFEGEDPILARKMEPRKPLALPEFGTADKTLSLGELRSLPQPHSVSGIYFLFLGAELQYIGQSANVYLRVTSHKKTKEMPFDNWRFIPAKLDDLDYIESAYIRKHTPPFNVGFRRRKSAGLPPVEKAAVRIYND